jgi:polyisoprenoid-binding protein YceI
MGSLNAQKYYTKTGTVSFVSSSSMEKIEAVTKSANCVLDIPTGSIEMAILIKSFNFEKALMQEHFNENYMESDKFPKAMLKGTITNINDLTLMKDGKYEGKLKGVITIHGESKPVESKVSFTVNAGNILATSELKISLADFKIEIPALVKDNIGKTVDIYVNTRLEALKKPQ